MWARDRESSDSSFFYRCFQGLVFFRDRFFAIEQFSYINWFAEIDIELTFEIRDGFVFNPVNFLFLQLTIFACFRFQLFNLIWADAFQF